HRRRFPDLQRRPADPRRLRLYSRIPDRTPAARQPRAPDPGGHQRNHARDRGPPPAQYRRGTAMMDWRKHEHVGLKVEADGHVAVVTLDNPPAPTWTVHSLSALRDLVGALNADKTIYALVITGGGEK